MPHVNEMHRARLGAAALALVLLAGCTDSTRHPPLMVQPTGQNLAHAGRLAPGGVTGRPVEDVVGSADAPVPATTSLSLNAGRRP